MRFKSLFNRKKKSLPNSKTPSPSSSPPVNSPAKIEEELEQVFSKFDMNGDGKISSLELGFIMASLGNAVTEEESVNMIKEVDADGDGFIDLQEFIELNTKNIDSNEILENLKEAFSVFDVDKNGSISADELQNVMKRLGEECSLEECREMIGGVDCDGDGMIDFEEFKVMMVRGSRSDLMDSRC
ncbi:PREDICTED: probable calcium-binding protein CML25 [Nicotiana attenuata]|uniref:Calcium-binding protein cml25 n=1 Tax=Nicotiana attenuata TaxID=49451 RepID=A0A1J6HWR3_NICAT|nr:PREDICTED: probable calcium-binding protein CML25 [Nicotiana attenuata]OIS96817.1 putative calcium-binding protein cml25 [Nicotiana attenuata]